MGWGWGGVWMDRSCCSLGNAGAADAEPSGCIATGKQLNKAAGPLGTLLEPLLTWEQHEQFICQITKHAHTVQSPGEKKVAVIYCIM